MTGNAGLGRWGESLARRRLESAGYGIAATNYRCRDGEIDIVAVDADGEVVFVEVKTRRGGAFGLAAEAISPARAERLVLAAEHYLQARVDGGYQSGTSWRIDLVCVNLDRGGKLLSVEHIKHALEF